MSHDAEQLAARFLAGLMSDEERGRYETHLLSCDRCWTEVESARAGRGVLEGLRTTAPAGLRDRVRAVVDVDTPAPPRRTRRPASWHRPPARLVAAAAVLVVVAAGLGLGRLLTAGTPMADVVAAYQQPAVWSHTSAAPPTRSLAGLQWAGARTGRLDGTRVVGHTYRGADGARVMVIVSESMVPAPPEARPVPGGDWQVSLDGVTVFCTQQPNPSLVVGADRATVARSAAAWQRAVRSS